MQRTHIFDNKVLICNPQGSVTYDEFKSVLLNIVLLKKAEGTLINLYYYNTRMFQLNLV